MIDRHRPIGTVDFRFAPVRKRVARNWTVLGSPKEGIANHSFAFHAGIRLNPMKGSESFRASSHTPRAAIANMTFQV